MDARGDAWSGGARGYDLTPDQLAALRPYVVNLNQGRFSSGGGYSTTPADVQAIFRQHLPRFLEGLPASARPAPLVIWAHGGLVDEAGGLRIAHGQVSWWLRNGAYPLHFVWESGLLDALKQLAGGVIGRRDRWDHTTDPLIEVAVGPLGGRAWQAMKSSAELASRAAASPGGPAEGGARFVARELATFCRDNPGALTLHAVGHSAGSIFHAHFLPAALEEDAPGIASLQLLAPAIRVDEFLARVRPRLGKGIGALSVFTMRRELERADTCLGAYHKSLLYLVQRAFEPEPEAPILGLEDSLRGNADLVRLFGLGARKGTAEVVWSKTETGPLRSRTTSTTHGGFDNDRPTMDSIARRILGRDGIIGFPAEQGARARSVWRATGAPEEEAAPQAPGPFTPTGRRRALCVGIDAYPAPNALGGCVADARLWQETLADLGFEVDLLLDKKATRQAILDGLATLLGEARPGDVVVFQYSGHGTEVPDLDGDEVEGTNGDNDEALCPVDFTQGRLLIDDDVRAVMDTLAEGVNLTVLADCCHSGSNTRALARSAARGPSAPGESVRARYVRADAGLIEKHRAFRKKLGAADTPRSGGGGSAMKEAAFAACQDHEVALERDGQGDFTRHAVGVLASGIGGLTNRGFERRVVEAFGPAREQTPLLDCAGDVCEHPLLQPFGPARPPSPPAPEGEAGTPSGRRALARLLREAADALEADEAAAPDGPP